MRTSLTRALVFVVAGAGAALLAAGCGSSNNGSHGGADGGTDGASSSGSSSGSGTTGSSSGENGGDGGEDGGTTSSSSGGSSSGSSSGGGDAGDAGCVFETLVTGIITNPPATAVPCNTPLCGCTDDGVLITKVQGSF